MIIDILKKAKSERVEIAYYDDGKGLDEASERRMIGKFAPKFADGYLIMRDKKLSEWYKTMKVHYFFIGLGELNNLRVGDN